MDDLILQTKRLYDNFDIKFTNEMLVNKVNFIRKELPNMSGYEYKLAVDEIVRDNLIKKFPTIGQIKALLPDKSAKDRNGCGKCFGGYISVWRQERGTSYSYAYRCQHCNGSEKLASIPTLPSEYESIPREQLLWRQ